MSTYTELTEEEILTTQPIMEYNWIKTDEIEFHQRIRTICENECPRYNTSWSCPPAVGTVEECRAKVLEYSDCFIFSTIAEVDDITNFEAALKTRMEHERVTQQVVEIFRKHFGKVQALSTESCEICEKCAWPDGPCRHPELMYPCVESFAIVVSNVAEKHNMSFDNGANVITWFSMVFFNDREDGE